MIRSKKNRDLRYNNFSVDSTSITFDESSSKTYHGDMKKTYLLPIRQAEVFSMSAQLLQKKQYFGKMASEKPLSHNILSCLP